MHCLSGRERENWQRVMLRSSLQGHRKIFANPPRFWIAPDSSPHYHEHIFQVLLRDLKKHGITSDSSSSPWPLNQQFPDRGEKGQRAKPRDARGGCSGRSASRWCFPMHFPQPARGFLWCEGNLTGKSCDFSPMADSLVSLSLFPEESYGTCSLTTDPK